MAARVLYVSVAQSFDPGFSLAELEPWVERAWAISVAKASACDRVVAVHENAPVGAWRIRGAYPTSETYRVSNGDERPRAGLSLGDPLPILPAYCDIPVLRRGAADVERPVPELPEER
ncbi:MAG: hypothetical protein M3Z75_21405 [Actinomycetota bacterium]|nr:hypothetical protein [Actinomycetota bacterium]